MHEGIEFNRRMWNERARINVKSDLYAHQDFLNNRRNTLHEIERRELEGLLPGARVLHLMCHFGHDTLSMAMLGADVTGVDFSEDAIAIARESAVALHLPARFIVSNLYDLPQHLDETFDIVFMSYGVLTWLPDLRAWAELIARYLKPGGTFYMAEYHPAVMIFDDEATTPALRYSYFNEGALVLEVKGSYADRDAETQEKVSYEWAYPLGEVITQLVNVGLKLEYLHEFAQTNYPMFDWLERREDGYWYVPEGLPALPLVFSVKAKKA